MVALLVGAIGLGVIVVFVANSVEGLGASRQIAELQSSLDLASFALKGALDESSSETILDSGARLQVSGGSPVWRREFYKSGTTLVMRNTDTGATRTVAPYLNTAVFTAVGDTIRVDLSFSRTVEGKTRTASTSFRVFLRNK